MEPSNKFKEFIQDILRIRCRLRQSTIDKYFYTKEGWEILQRAFIHDSLGSPNYQLLEFEGDVVVNHATAEHIRERFPEVTSVKWVTRIKHNLVSGKTLGKLSMDNGFEEFFRYSDDLEETFNKYGKRNCDKYIALAEDVFEALTGAISKILNNNGMKGVAYKACYNFVTSFLSNIEIPLVYEIVFDAKSRLKELFDDQRWDKIEGCTLKKNLFVKEMGDVYKSKYLKNQLNYALNNQKQGTLGFSIDTTHRFIAFGYACVKGTPKSKQLFSVISANNKSDAEQTAAEAVISRLRRLNVNVPISDAYSS